MDVVIVQLTNSCAPILSHTIFSLLVRSFALCLRQQANWVLLGMAPLTDCCDSAVSCVFWIIMSQQRHDIVSSRSGSLSWKSFGGSCANTLLKTQRPRSPFSSPSHLKGPSFSPYNRMILIQGLVSTTEKKSHCGSSTCLYQWRRPIEVINLLNKKPVTAVHCTTARHGNMGRCNYWWYLLFQSWESTLCRLTLLASLHPWPFVDVITFGYKVTHTKDREIQLVTIYNAY